MNAEFLSRQDLQSIGAAIGDGVKETLDRWQAEAMEPRARMFCDAFDERIVTIDLGTLETAAGFLEALGFEVGLVCGAYADHHLLYAQEAMDRLTTAGLTELADALDVMDDVRKNIAGRVLAFGETLAARLAAAAVEEIDRRLRNAGAQ